LVSATVSAGEEALDVVVKLPRAPQGASLSCARLVEPVTDPERKSRLEYAALAAAADEFSHLGDERFGWVQPYAHLPELGALVVAELQCPTLDQLLRRVGPRRFPSSDQHAAMRNLGALLGVFHTLQTPEMEHRADTSAELAAELSGLIGSLRDAGRAARLPSDIDRVGEWLGAASDSQPLVLGLGHGDLAPRNVFVDADLKITLIDSLGRFRVPVQEDAAYLLVELSTGSTRFARRGVPRSPAQVRALRSAFLDGYPMADDPVLWFFELRAFLDKWRSLLRHRDRARRNGVGRRGRRGSTVSSAREYVLAREVAAVVDRFESVL
jgi:hypothetical protein